MHRISKLAAIAAVTALLLTSATPDHQSRVLMRVGGSAATIADYRLLFGAQTPPTDTILSLLALHLCKLEDARVTSGDGIPTDTAGLTKLIEWGQAISNITARRTILRAEADSAERENFFRTHPQLFRWNEPHFVGSVVLTTDPGKARAIADSMKTLPGTLTSTSKDFRIINYNVARGLNPYVDFAAFGLPVSLPENDRWKDAAVITGDIFDQPQYSSQVSELLTTLLADSLYSRWTDSLSAALPAEIDRETLDFLKN